MASMSGGFVLVIQHPGSLESVVRSTKLHMGKAQRDTSSSSVAYKSESVVGWGGSVVAAQHNVKLLTL